MRYTRNFLDSIHAKSASKLVNQIKRESLILGPKTADDFRATIGAIRSLDESDDASLDTLLPEDR